MIDVLKSRRPLFEIRRLNLFVGPHEGKLDFAITRNWNISDWKLFRCQFDCSHGECCYIGEHDGKLGVHFEDDDHDVLDDNDDEHDDANDSKLGRQTGQACPWPHWLPKSVIACICIFNRNWRIRWSQSWENQNV